MSKPETIKIDEVEYVRADSAKVAPSTKQIVILQRGWIVVGDVRKEANEFHIQNCSVIRAWGTTKGLGEIALNGPTSSTKLDPCGTMQVHELAVVGRMNVDASKWR